MTLSNLQTFEALIAELLHFFDEGISLEQEKIQVIKKNRVSFLDEYMKKEQAFILKLRGYDRTRETLQTQLGYADKSFQEILSSCSKEEYECLQPLFYQLTQKVTLFQELSLNAKDLIKVQLHNIETLIAEASNQPGAFSFTNRTI